MLPSIFGENMMDEFFDRDFFGERNPLFGKHARNLMKTDIHENDKEYELSVELPGFKKEEISLEDKMTDMKRYARTHREFSFRGILEKQASKIQVIVTFLSILELMKIGYIQICQEKLFDDIKITSLKYGQPEEEEVEEEQQTGEEQADETD